MLPPCSLAVSEVSQSAKIEKIDLKYKNCTKKSKKNVKNALLTKGFLRANENNTLLFKLLH